MLMGGDLVGWTSDVAVVIWKRLLGSLGNINKIRDPEIHAQVYDYLVHLTNTLIKVKNI